ncbi:hypothetical protein [Klebsiella pneumoniae]|uniref:hypothetical protein n=1 Tax=Klebsiella pneumoniae TaxID=573 RepID=UPI00226E3E91|nr:hypothetical protein [Klebsiella pneumoniae]
MTMTTDITELAQREKFEAWARSQKLGLSYGDCGYVFSSTEMAWRAWMTSSAELVEALEKAQQRISELESPTFTFEVTAEPFTCPRCGTTTTHPEGWHYCHKQEAE